MMLGIKGESIRLEKWLNDSHSPLLEITHQTYVKNAFNSFYDNWAFLGYPRRFYKAHQNAMI